MVKRHHVTEQRVQSVIDGLVRQLRAVGSVNALTELLSAGAGQRIYPNRIHGLLSEDNSRSVTEATLCALEEGLSAMPVLQGDVAPFIGFDAKVAAAGAAIVDGQDRVAGVASALEVPPAVVRRALPNAGAALSDTTPSAKSTTSSPDWSWQDGAVRHVAADLRETPQSRVGLIVPTGGGKTRVGLRCILDYLAAQNRTDTIALWVTHRRNLHRQARKDLQVLLKERDDQLPDGSASMFESRIKFIMVGEVAKTLEELGDRAVLIVIDEAHHAAAPTYAPVFDHGGPVILLTATPVRADRLPIGVDNIAFTITYRELFERKCIVEPVFEPPLDLPGLDWSTSDGLRDLADYLLDRTESDFGKVLVAVSQQERAERLYEAVIDVFEQRQGHPLDNDDIAFVHGGSNSLRTADAGDALDEFSSKPAGILIATSALVGEGFNDPSIDSVVVTYPSMSIAHLMQVAGRALRWAPYKDTAHVVQLRESSLQYYFDQRWLYQDISDELRPDLIDVDYATRDDLRLGLTQLLEARHVDSSVHQRILAQVDQTEDGQDIRIMLAGINYYGSSAAFTSDARWNAIFIDSPEYARFLNIYNYLSLRREDLREAQVFLREYVPIDLSAGGLWKSYMDLINASEYARQELRGETSPTRESRPYRPASNTTWLTYVTYRYRPQVPTELDTFLTNAVNRDEVLAAYVAERGKWRGAVRVELPLSGTVAFLLDEYQDDWLNSERLEILDRLQQVPAADAFTQIRLWRDALPLIPAHMMIANHIAQLLSASRWDDQHLALKHDA
ncbi:DEAD/DEAH box helicase family protein [uncultured Rhodococcus sp.]|uniref:DEAD/DEAH box helicase n=1 Tax=uncultured Rhodococcus sp. TaxID=194249 RepID=UPI0028DC801A|nr:DEAD/DEAH box helicase family protein [uncultured Rhodococcus sp.]